MLHFSYLVTVMGLVIPWNFTLALVDGYSVLVKCPIRQHGILLLIVVGDWVNQTQNFYKPSSISFTNLMSLKSKNIT